MSRIKRKQKSDRLGCYLTFVTVSLVIAIIVEGRISLNPVFYLKAMAAGTLVYTGGLLLLSVIDRIRLAGSSMSQIDKMSGEDFEKYLGILYKRAGYKIEFTPGTMDFGADLIVSKYGVRTVVQAKRYRKQVGEAAVQQALSGKEYYHADICMVVTNSDYTYAAKELAKKAGVRLINRWKLGTSSMYPKQNWKTK